MKNCAIVLLTLLTLSIAALAKEPILGFISLTNPTMKLSLMKEDPSKKPIIESNVAPKIDGLRVTLSVSGEFESDGTDHQKTAVTINDQTGGVYGQPFGFYRLYISNGKVTVYFVVDLNEGKLVPYEIGKVDSLGNVVLESKYKLRVYHRQTQTAAIRKTFGKDEGSERWYIHIDGLGCDRAAATALSVFCTSKAN